MHSPDRYALALAMLEGDRDARKILADLLEEQGDRGLAQWARQGRHDKRRTLAFALMLVPCRAAIELANDFVIHAFVQKAIVRMLNPFPALVASWCRGDLRNADLLIQARDVLRGIPVDWHLSSPQITAVERQQRLKTALENIIASIECTIRAEGDDPDLPPSGSPQQLRSTALLHLRAVATASQNQAAPTRQPATPTAPATEVDWQIQQTRILLTKLIAQDDSWPK